MDIVEKLLSWDIGYHDEAAAEIERLREALKKITKVRYYGPQGPYKESHEMHEIANQALKGGE